MKKTEVVKLTPEQRSKFQEYLYLCDEYKYSYFWHNFIRSSTDKREEQDCLDYETVVNGVEYVLHFRVSFSRKNCYVSKYVYRDGNRSNGTVIKNLLAKDISVCPSESGNQSA